MLVVPHFSQEKPHLDFTITNMTLNRALLVLALTFVMCVGSGSLATRKLVQLDPADVF